MQNIFEIYQQLEILELQDLLNKAENREEKLFYSYLLKVKMGIRQEKVVGKELL